MRFDCALFLCFAQMRPLFLSCGLELILPTLTTAQTMQLECSAMNGFGLFNKGRGGNLGLVHEAS